MAHSATLPFLLLALSLSIGTASAQRYPMTYVPGSVAGEQIELIQHQIDTLKKIEQIERFLQYFPTHPAASHFLEWLQGYYLRAGQADRALSTGEKLLALHPLDFDTALRCQKAAALKNDPALNVKWEDKIFAFAKQIVKMQKPQGLDDQAWKQNVDFSTSLLAEREYKDYRAAYDAPSARLKAQMFEDFLRKYPNSQYEAQTWPQLMILYRTMGDSARAMSTAEKVLAQDENDPDALLLISRILLEKRTDHARAIATSRRVLQTLSTRAKPAQFSNEDWERRKSYYIGTAHLQIGNAYVNQNNFSLADKELRSSLPFVKGMEQTEAAVLFYLGWANYQMENYREAAGFFRLCTALAGAGEFAEQATRNLTALKNERRLVE